MPSVIIAIFNLVAPQVFQFIKDSRNANPQLSYRDALEQAGVKLDAEYTQLLADMARDVAEGAVPRTPPQ